MNRKCRRRTSVADSTALQEQTPNTGGREAVEHKDVRDKLATFPRFLYYQRVRVVLKSHPAIAALFSKCFPVHRQQKNYIMQVCPAANVIVGRESSMANYFNTNLELYDSINNLTNALKERSYFIFTPSLSGLLRSVNHIHPTRL